MGFNSGFKGLNFMQIPRNFSSFRTAKYVQAARQTYLNRPSEEM